jgi:hypothetical protein
LESFTEYWKGVQDFGGDGKYVLPNCKNAFYTSQKINEQGVLGSGSMRFRPIIETSEVTEKLLYHPVKTQLTDN